MLRSPGNQTRSRPRRAARAAAGLFVLLAALATAPAAMAGKPTGEYAVFNDCPLGTTGVNECVYIHTTSGEVQLGSLTVPFAHAITLQGGLIVSEKEEKFANTTEGQTLAVVSEEVPGGFLGLPRMGEKSSMSVALELVGAVELSRGNLSGDTGTALKLPVRAHLIDEFFGTACYVGSSASPITLHLTTGATSPPKPNKTITGSSGVHESKEEGKLAIYNGDSLVENAFSVPEAKACGGVEEFLVDPTINSKYRLPAAGGNSTAIFKGTSEFANAEAVKKSE
jgi:hypothetical protein